ncbi:MAG: exodeoxyribonuclease VII small subunit [Prevotellaceae bacterium]|nr:exodeoxyribonuclease VII small subunit [Candidatus Minthosoma caballi]
MEKELTYEQAMKRLQEIVEKIERGEMDIDSLATNLKEAKDLVAFCKDKLTKVEADVKKCLDL